MKTSRFLTETSYPDVPGGILSSSHLSFLPVVRSAAQLCQITLLYFKSVTYYLYRFCYVIYHRLCCTARHQLIWPARRAHPGGVIGRQLPSFRPLSLRLTPDPPVTFLQTNVACSFQIGLLCRSVPLRS